MTDTDGFSIFKNRLDISGVLTTVTALRIGSGRSLEPIGTDLPVIKDAFGNPLIPGSSFKGAMRSRLESFLRAIDESLAANPTNEAEWAITNEQLNGKDGIKAQIEKQYPEAERDRLLSQRIMNETDFASQVFGSPWSASKFQVRDLNVVADSWFGQYQERDGVSIDRDTETASDGRLYDFQVVPAGTTFEFRAIVENAEPWELGLISIGLHQFETEQIPLGGGRSRGLGVVRLENLGLQWFDACDSGKSKPNPERLKNYLMDLVTNQAQAFEDGSKYRQQWGKAFINQLPLLIKPASATQPAESKP